MHYTKREREVMLSICIITKNEQQNIERCLQCLQPYPFEIVVVDTGSTDKTKEIALKYTENVYDFAWCDDFGAAKNYAISKAENEYVMVLDSDEFLEPLEAARLEQLIMQHPQQVGRIKRRNLMTRNGQKQENVEWINRIFSKKRFHYEGRIHEQVMALDGCDYDTYKTPVVIEHSGYDLPEAERKKKAERNITLLLQELERLEAEQKSHNTGQGEAESTQSEMEAVQDGLTAADEKLPYILYQLGKSYYMAGDYALSCEYFSRGLSFDLNPKLEYVIDMVETYGYALINSGRAEEALFFENIYEEFGNSADFQFLMGLIYMNNARFEEAIAEFLKAAEHTECRTLGVNSYLAYYNVGVVYECLGHEAKAAEYYKKCGDYAPAEKQLAGLTK